MAASGSQGGQLDRIPLAELQGTSGFVGEHGGPESDADYYDEDD